ncbi:MAG: hypothetical protein CMP49_01620 [Flavobacteriales bacterium]|jgi:hypothetical protein|nr:hypothetical protein [Flavobacteriales bacterium]|tara:strand:- start:376 stop:600 length:225 start_codon:yes stop_codon:yes gene_type:complete
MNRLKWLIIIFFAIAQNSYSQCAMCRVVAESSQDAGGTIANNLNTGILYLMIFPYLLILYALISSYFKIDKTTN